MSHVDEGTLHAYLDGELPPGERSALETHLAQCAACTALLAEERALLDRSTALLASAAPRERPAPPFEQVRRSPRRPWYLRTPAMWAASIVLALGLGYYMRDAGSERRLPAAPDSRTVGAADGFSQSQESAAAPVALAAQPETVATMRAARRLLQRGTETRAEEKAQDKAARDSNVEGVVALGERVALRNTTPFPVVASAPSRADSAALRLDEVVIVSGASGIAALRGRAVTSQWQIISRGAATTLLGTDPVGLPGLRTRRIRRSPAPDATVVVEQALDSATTIQIFQRPLTEQGYVEQARESAPSAAAARAPAPADRLARFVGRLRVEISGPLTTDSLNKLLDQLEPLP